MEDPAGYRERQRGPGGTWAAERAEAADRLCDHRGAEGQLVRSLWTGVGCVCMYLDVMGHVRYAAEGSCWLGTGMDTGDQGSVG